MGSIHVKFQELKLSSMELFGGKLMKGFLFFLLFVRKINKGIWKKGHATLLSSSMDLLNLKKSSNLQF